VHGANAGIAGTVRFAGIGAVSARSILLIGATGVFGSRLAQGLTSIEGCALTLTSRDAAPSERFAAQLRSEARGAQIDAMAFDTSKDLSRLAQIKPWLVVDASGPFQGGNFRLAQASLAAGAHYLDLADAREHVLGFAAALDPLARKKGLVALTGASSTPALSGAVVEAVTRGWTRIDAIDAAITPGGASEVGQSVIEAILSYVGRPVTIWRAGRLQSVRGWGSIERWTMPGLGKRLVSPVETPDAELLSQRFAVRNRVRFLAGLESHIEQFGMLALSWTLGRRSQSRLLARLLHRARRITRLACGDRGAMLVEVSGLDPAGAPVRACWSLLAERNHGLRVPTFSALAVVRALMADEVSPGARPCLGVVKLEAIEREMQGYAITASREISTIEAPELFRAALGDEVYASLPAALRGFHDRAAETVWLGRADVDVGASFVARIARRAFGLPAAGRDLPITVSLARDGESETWVRDFGPHRFLSRLRRTDPGHIEETLGPFAFDLALDAHGSRVSMPVLGWRFLGIPLPRFCAPISNSHEFEDADGRYRFDVRLSLPLCGLLAHYRGWLAPMRQPETPAMDRPKSRTI
jgi:saccharopine dehydrogenase-like NADP-dependent oxidoreductase